MRASSRSFTESRAEQTGRFRIIGDQNLRKKKGRKIRTSVPTTKVQRGRPKEGTTTQNEAVFNVRSTGKRDRCGEKVDGLPNSPCDLSGASGTRSYLLRLRTTMPPKASESPQPVSESRSLFTVPTPIKLLFDKFPLATYPANDLPQRCPSRRHENQLFVFSDAAGARRGRPSFNPQCLKWQVRLRRRSSGGQSHRELICSFL